jgi:ABC-type transport system involved in cytochrome c biogenesis permease subunit
LLFNRCFFTSFKFSSNGKYERENSKPELTATELPLTNELNLAWSSEINDKNQADTSSQLSATLDNLSYRILSLGFPLLTIGILSGAVWANQTWGSY